MGLCIFGLCSVKSVGQLDWGDPYCEPKPADVLQCSSLLSLCVWTLSRVGGAWLLVTREELQPVALYAVEGTFPRPCSAGVARERVCVPQNCWLVWRPCQLGSLICVVTSRKRSKGREAERRPSLSRLHVGVFMCGN